MSVDARASDIAGGNGPSSPSVPAESSGPSLARLTTLELGGPARRFIEAASDQGLIAAVSGADAEGAPVLVLGGGSNLVVADGGFPGTVVAVRTRGVSCELDGDRARLAIAAGEPWDELAGWAVAEGFAGIECLAGIPGLAGAAPIQNVGAYGQEIAEVIRGVRVYDRVEGRVVELAPGQCHFAYRSSIFRGSDRHVVLSLTIELERSGLARPVSYAELAGSLGVGIGGRPPLGAVREAVLNLRRRKGMVLDPGDPDSVSAGSFFINPVLSGSEFGALLGRVSEALGEGVSPPAWPQPPGERTGTGTVKTSAAWLIEHAGFHRGFGDGAVGISSKHTLALVNRGGASTTELIACAREIRDGVRDRFGVELRPEPTLVGVEL